MGSSSRDLSHTASVKERTWPASVCLDPANPALWNVRGIDGVVIFTPGLGDKLAARQACRGINEHFDYGRSAGR